MSDCKHEYESASKSSGGHDFRYEFAQCSKCYETLDLSELIDEVNRSRERIKELETSLRRVREKSIMALSSLSIASKTLREIEGV